MHLYRSIKNIMINRTNDRSIDLIMKNENNAIRAIGCSIEHSIISYWIDHLIVLQSIKLIHFDRLFENIIINQINDRSELCNKSNHMFD
jgi:hypothetical protein